MKALVMVFAISFLLTIAAAQSNSSATLIQLSNTHVGAIANGSLAIAEQGYLPNAYVFVNIDFTNFSNTYYGQQEITAALTNLTSYGTPYAYRIENTSAVEINSTEYSVNRYIWFVSKNQTYTIQVPYSATYAYVQGAWYISAEWFGTSSARGTVLNGNQAPVNQTTTTTINATTTAALQQNTTTSQVYTIPGQSQQGQTNNATQNQTTQRQQSNNGLLYLVFAILAIGIIVLYVLMIRRRA